jgi:EAL domain-containing protein (putative c-di-GMP-specific phosphodiesterase class I)
MLLPEIKEREYRFKLALRMGLPIFGLALALIISTFTTTQNSLQPSFYFTSILLLVFSIYFIFFLIYKGFDEKITQNVTKTFTREYLYKFLKNEIKHKKEYTLILISIDNLNDINTRYGILNGDKILFEIVKYISSFFIEKKIRNFPMGHIKGGDFVIGVEGKKEDYIALLELFYLKSNELKIDDIEVNISGAITDTKFSNELEYMIENLFELQQEQKNKRTKRNIEEINTNKLETYVVKAIKSQSIVISTQNVYENNIVKIKECFIKLKSEDGKILYPKSYMKIINRLGLTAQYDYMILQKSISNCTIDDNIMFSISISPSSLRNKDFLIKTKELLRENSSLARKIIFMLSETEYYSHIDKYNYNLKSLKKLGVKIAIDRLGSLHTSFLYLRDLDIDIIRFDSAYTKDSNKYRYKNILEGFNKMAHNNSIKTWIKMIESKEINDFVDGIGIDYVQGKELAKLEKIYED